MEDNHNERLCVRDTLEKIIYVQKNVINQVCDLCKISQDFSLNQQNRTECVHMKNAIPVILFCDCEPFKLDGVISCIEPCHGSEIFNCFSTFIFRIKAIKGKWALVELLKFNEHSCFPSNDDTCSLCFQVKGNHIDELVSTDICVAIDLTCFNAMQCLPAVCL